MSTLKHLLITFTLFFFISSTGYSEEADAKKMEQSIATLNKLRIQHFTLLGKTNKEKTVNDPNEKAIKDAAKYTFNNIKNGDLIFKYPGILGIGWLSRDKEGYQLLLYADYSEFGDAAEPNPQYYIIYISKKGIIAKTIATPSLEQ